MVKQYVFNYSIFGDDMTKKIRWSLNYKNIYGKGVKMANKTKILAEKEVVLNGEKYICYLKEVPSKIGIGGTVEATVIRPFIKKK